MLNISDWPPSDEAAVFNYLRWSGYRSEQHKLFYVSTPKVACTSLKWWFASLVGCSKALSEITDSAESNPDQIVHEMHRVAPHVTGLAPAELREALTSDSYFRFAVVRNPYKRIFSAWQSKLLLQEPQQVGPYLQRDFYHQPLRDANDIALAFEGFLEHLASQEAPTYWDQHWTPQVMLLRPDLISYSVLTKIEEAPRLSKALAEHLGEFIPDPFADRRANESLIPYLPEFVTERSASLIRTLYAEDFAVLGYDTEPPKAKETFTHDELMLALRAIKLIRGRHQSLGERSARIVALGQTVATLEAKIASLDAYAAESATQITEFRLVAEKREAEIDKLTRQIDNLKTQLVVGEEEIARIQLQKDAEVAAARQELQKAYESRSWRVTLPLRRSGVLARRTLRRLSNTSLGKAIQVLRERRARVDESAISLLGASELFDNSYYLTQNPDVKDQGVDPLVHYLNDGWKEGRNPSAFFSNEKYLRDYPDVAAAAVNPLVHYLSNGRLEGRSIAGHVRTWTRKKRVEAEARPIVFQQVSPEIIAAQAEAIRNSGMFDADYYLAMYPELKKLNLDPIRHYCGFGWYEGKNPSDDFDTVGYLETYKDIQAANINPFWHYVVSGASEQRITVPGAAIRYEDDVRFGFSGSSIKLFALYVLPHWDKLRDARSSSKGGAQLLPNDYLGFYDPLDSEVLEKQVRLAKSHGLYGFCFQWDSHAGADCPQQPVDVFLDHKNIDFQFCVRISAQEENLPARLREAVRDRRYLRVEGRPVVVVECSTPNNFEALSDLRDRLSQLDIKAYLIAQSAQVDDGIWNGKLSQLCDAVLDLPVEPLKGEIGTFSPQQKNGIAAVPYSVIVANGITRAENSQSHSFPVFNGITLARDESAYAAKSPLVYTRFCAREYRRWLDAAITSAKTRHSKDRQLVFVNAWNDWSHGLFLEPDRVAGFGRVNETSRGLLAIKSKTLMPKVSVIVPNYNHERFLRKRLDSIYGQTYRNFEVILMDDCSSDESRSVLNEYAQKFPDVTTTLFNDTNSGGVFRQWSKGIKAATGDLVWVAESDDYCDENFLQALVRCFDDEAVMLAYARCEFVTSDEVVQEGEFHKYVSDLECAEKWAESYVDTAHSEVRYALGIKNTIPNASGVVFKRPVDLPLLDDEEWLSMRVAGDWVFYLHLIRGGKVAYSVDGTNFFRRYVGSAAQQTYKREVFYRELGIASRTVQALYNVPLSVLELCEESSRRLYDINVNNSQEEFYAWYGRDAIFAARANRTPNIMVSTIGFYPGGAEILPIRLANEFKRQGYSVILLSAGLTAREDGVRRMLRADVPLVETNDLDEVKSLISEFGIEALNSHQWHIQKYPISLPGVFSQLGSHVASLHGMIEHGDAFAVTEEQLKAANREVTTWVYTAEKNIGPFVNFSLYEEDSGRFIKVPNGLQPPTVVPVEREQLGIAQDAFVLCCVSRAIPDKGWDEAIEAVTLARAISGVDIRLLLVGNGPVYDEYCRVGVPDFVCLTGFSKDSVGHYAAADMGIMLTKFKSESFPLTIVDCLFAGKPYIASEVGDIRNMLTIGDQIAGEVIALEDWEVPIEQTAKVIAGFASDNAKYREAFGRVKEVSNRYRIDAVAAQYVSLFERDIKARKE
ncbi:glycoside hydrolase family 99-like domain-containing protein [Pseudomonas pharyngis]|uniref:glycoside hydrolase family 99-like domain-containing protein n=1 Tax=Pseudomonas pharyngis TaxID=2892333 RepID=UPI001F1A514D|nr:glycoside hydrolase family 99-like domain-containing protein [Pseudomonas pharyngis]